MFSESDPVFTLETDPASFWLPFFLFHASTVKDEDNRLREQEEF